MEGIVYIICEAITSIKKSIHELGQYLVPIKEKINKDIKYKIS